MGGRRPCLLDEGDVFIGELYRVGSRVFERVLCLACARDGDGFAVSYVPSEDCLGDTYAAPARYLGNLGRLEQALTEGSRLGQGQYAMSATP